MPSIGASLVFTEYQKCNIKKLTRVVEKNTYKKNHQQKKMGLRDPFVAEATFRRQGKLANIFEEP